MYYILPRPAPAGLSCRLRRFRASGAAALRAEVGGHQPTPATNRQGARCHRRPGAVGQVRPLMPAPPHRARGPVKDARRAPPEAARPLGSVLDGEHDRGRSPIHTRPPLDGERADIPSMGRLSRCGKPATGILRFRILGFGGGKFV
jgi:hypothetical protein